LETQKKYHIFVIEKLEKVFATIDKHNDYFFRLNRENGL